MRIVPVLAVILAALPAAAAERVMVHGIVPPAWIERGQQVLPLRPELLILEGDQVRTGPGGRVEVDLPDGSAVRLGATAQLQMTEARMQRVAEDDVFSSALHLIKGAFRFTTHAFAKANKRDVRISVGVVTIGVRGTDLIVVADEAGDKIMLVEGRIELTGMGMAAPMMMEKSMDSMSVSREGLMQHLAMGSDDMTAMDAMTAMPAGSGMLMMGMAPKWDVVVLSLQSRARADAVAAELGAQGWPMEVEEASVGGVAFNRVAVHGFPSKAEAAGFAQRVAGIGPIHGAWLKHH